jgi:hypothetical protein
MADRIALAFFLFWAIRRTAGGVRRNPVLV